MPSKKAASPQQVAALAVGAVLAVAGAFWSISNALAPTPAPPAPPANGASNAAPPPTASAPAQTEAAPAAPASAPAASAEREAANSEALLAPGANPFAPVVRPITLSSPQPLPTPAAPAANASPPPQVASAPPRALLPTGLPTIRGLQVRPQDIQAPPMPPQPAAKPELVGTLLGDRPSGVFRVDGHLTVVSVGDSIDTWKVLSVRHGEAVVKSGGRTERIRVGMRAASDTAHRQGVSAERTLSPGEGVHPGEVRVVEGSDPKSLPTGEGVTGATPHTEGGKKPAVAPAAPDAGASETVRPPQVGADQASATGSETPPQQSDGTQAVPPATTQAGSSESASPFTAAADSSGSSRSTNAGNPFARHSLYLVRVGAGDARPAGPSRPAAARTVAFALPADDRHRRQVRLKHAHRVRRHHVSGRRRPHHGRRPHRRHHARRHTYRRHTYALHGLRYQAMGLRRGAYKPVGQP
ncbi:MAG TPA: hypothetical protein VFB21_19885 [Chthonomonadaceae bacterium]|nr:hypothetical protein [Chthonomonadaceae bacterium]